MFWIVQPQNELFCWKRKFTGKISCSVKTMSLYSQNYTGSSDGGDWVNQYWLSESHVGKIPKRLAMYAVSTVCTIEQRFFHFDLELFFDIWLGFSFLIGMLIRHCYVHPSLLKKYENITFYTYIVHVVVKG